MNLRKWFGIILALGLILALSPLNALAWRVQPSSGQRNFVPPRGHAYGYHGQRPPMYQHHRPPVARGHHPQQRYGQHHGNRHFQHSWMSRNHHRPPYAYSGYQGSSSNAYGRRHYGNGTNPYSAGGQYYQQGQYTYQQPVYPGGTTSSSTTTSTQSQFGGL